MQDFIVQTALGDNITYNAESKEQAERYAEYAYHRVAKVLTREEYQAWLSETYEWARNVKSTTGGQTDSAVA